MKTICLWLLLAGLLTGCNWMQLLAFRAQMRAIEEFTAWETESTETIFVFKTPLLTHADLNEFGIYPEVIDEGNAVLRYRRIEAPDEDSSTYDIRLRFTKGKLSGLIFPAKLRNGFGSDNIRSLFAMMGDAPGTRMRPLPKAQLVAAGLAPEIGNALGPEFSVALEPGDPRNNSIMLKFIEGEKPDLYSHFRLVLEKKASKQERVR